MSSRLKLAAIVAATAAMSLPVHLTDATARGPGAVSVQPPSPGPAAVVATASASPAEVLAAQRSTHEPVPVGQSWRGEVAQMHLAQFLVSHRARDRRQAQEREAARAARAARPARAAPAPTAPASAGGEEAGASPGSTHHAPAPNPGSCTRYGWDYSWTLGAFPEAERATACRVMLCESHVHPARDPATIENPRSSASGLFQFIDSTWRRARAMVGADQYPRAKDAPPQMQADAAAAWLAATSWTQWECYRH